MCRVAAIKISISTGRIFGSLTRRTGEEDRRRRQRAIYVFGRFAMTRIGALFQSLREQKRKGLIAYLTCGDPSSDRTPALIEALERGGADLIELGVPFSDPIADGPVIQRAGERALRAGTTLHKVLDIARAVRTRSEIPLLLFTYLNPVLRYGFEALAKDAAACAIDGCLLTDASV